MKIIRFLKVKYVIRMANSNYAYLLRIYIKHSCATGCPHRPNFTATRATAKSKGQAERAFCFLKLHAG